MSYVDAVWGCCMGMLCADAVCDVMCEYGMCMWSVDVDAMLMWCMEVLCGSDLPSLWERSANIVHFGLFVCLYVCPDA